MDSILTLNTFFVAQLIAVSPSCNPNMSFISKAAPLPDITLAIGLKTAVLLGNMVCSIYYVLIYIYTYYTLEVQPTWSLG